jgi:proline iminopeptidase
MKKIFLAALAALAFASCTKERMLNEPGNLVPKTVDQDPSLPSVYVNGALLHSEAYGHPDSTMIVVLHGGPGGDYRNLLNCRDLSAYGYRVVFYDQRGSGLSQRFPKNFYTSRGLAAIDLMYDDLTAVIAHYRKRSDQRVYLLGHSWGAMLATGYAGKYPHAVQGLVLAEPGGLKWNDVEDYVEESRSFDLWSEMLNNATYIDQFISGDDDEHEILDYKLMMKAGNNEITGENNTLPGSFWRSGAVINDAFFEVGHDHEPDFSSGIASYQPQVLFFYSGKNKAYSDSWAQRISSSYNHISVSKVAGVGHDGMFSDHHAWRNITMPQIITYFNSL